MDSGEPPRKPSPPPPSVVVPTSYASVPTTSPLISPNSAMLAPATARFPFGSQPPPPPPSSSSIPSEHFNSAAVADTSPYDGSSPSAALRPCGEFAKKKRGRPRKYSDDSIAAGLAPIHIPSSAAAAGAGGGDSSGTPSTEAPAKKHRGRPPGSVKRQLNALGAAGTGFTPHVILVESGEDITEKIMAFSQQGPRTVCVLSANGAVSNVTLRQPALSSGIATYEGRFEIVSLSGSLLPSENNDEHSRAGSLIVSLAGSDGRVLGGVAGTLTAASTVQIIVGSFIANGKKTSSNNLKSGPSSAPTSQMLTFGSPLTPTSPTSEGHSTESSEENDNSPFNRETGPYDDNASQPVNNMQTYHHPLWPGHGIQ